MKKFIFFARVCVWWTLAIPSYLNAQDPADIYPNYVVIGAFAIHNNAMAFTDEANKNNFPAKFEMNFNRNLYYVYVMTTDDRKFAFAEALKLRKDTKYFDTWVYSGPFQKIPLAELSSREYRDFNPQTGEPLIHENTSEGDRSTSANPPALTNNDQVVAANLPDGAAPEMPAEGRKSKKQERSSRRDMKEKGVTENVAENLKTQNGEMDPGVTGDISKNNNEGKSPANTGEKTNTHTDNGTNGLAIGDLAERNADAVEHRALNQPSTGADRIGGGVSADGGKTQSERDQLQNRQQGTSQNVITGPTPQTNMPALVTSQNQQDAGKTVTNSRKRNEGNSFGVPASDAPADLTLNSATQNTSKQTPTKQGTVNGQKSPIASSQNPKENATTTAQAENNLKGAGKDRSAGSGQQALTIQNTQTRETGPGTESVAMSDKHTSVTSGVKDLTSEELLKMNSLTEAGKKALLENRERVVNLGPPPQRATTAPLTKEEVTGKNFYFYLFRADNLATVDGEVDAIDFEKSRKMATYQGNAPVKVIMPSGKTKQISFVCEVFGYRKHQKEFDPANPSEDLYLNDKGDLVVPFELRRLQKGDIAIMYNVFFFKDAAVMRPESRYEVNNLLDLLVENPTYNVVIHGHTNGNATGKIIRMGTPGNFYSLTGTKQGFGSAKQLSEERAMVIREFLINSGISSDRMQIKAWGGKKPIHDKHSVRANENVRVEIEILSE